MSAALQICIERESALVQAFIEAIDAEARALADRKAHDALQQAAQEKEALAEQLSALSVQRDELLAGLGLPDGHEGTQQAASQFPELAESWNRLLEYASLARERNERNGAMISASLRHTQQALDALRQLNEGANASATYDAQGRGRRGYGQRSIIAT
ncbi:flagella biosynthesis protein [Bordetella ansorpii]|uniref:Flagella biosynthesis protein n=1 Tax=Bordetella ansorpii TaxID=288768 RepID=A0A157SLT4_9BORD|nr:flagellar protein FlgN [Bordetella ansorpii]SAI71274.1 flagella biosynthesis protein [Bordetella ansorpii]